MQQAFEVGALGVDSDKDGNDFVLDVVMSGNSKAALDRADAAYTAFLKAQRRACAASRALSFINGLKHDPENWMPVFGKDHAQRVAGNA
jgi:hypothetical protein